MLCRSLGEIDLAGKKSRIHPKTGTTTWVVVGAVGAVPCFMGLPARGRTD